MPGAVFVWAVGLAGAIDITGLRTGIGRQSGRTPLHARASRVDCHSGQPVSQGHGCTSTTCLSSPECFLYLYKASAC